MNIIFLTLTDINSIYDKNIYTDLLREFSNKGNHVYIVSPAERKTKKPTHIIDEGVCKILKVKIGNIQKTGIVEKGISTVLLESNYKNAIQKHLSDIKFDLILYSTPPITLASVVSYLKKRDRAYSYLLLKDIFPQNAVDLGILKRKGLNRFIYEYFRWKEKKLYDISDTIGCMSPANIEFVKKHNPQINMKKLELCPNSIETRIISYSQKEKKQIRKKYNIPLNKTVFIYGGNLGVPQGIDYLINSLRENKNNESVHFVIVGSGTEYNKIHSYFKKEHPNNAQLFKLLPKDDYEILVSSCDVGLIFLDPRFTIPNFPSRILSYMQASMPVLAATDNCTDIGEIIENGGFGYWCETNNIQSFNQKLNKLCDTNLREEMGMKGKRFLEDNYTTKHTYQIIMSHFN